MLNHRVSLFNNLYRAFLRALYGERLRKPYAGRRPGRDEKS
jgi:hypothetical protein